MQWSRHFVSASVMLFLAVQWVDADVVVINPSKDNSLYEEASGALSNGSGTFLFVGRTSTTGGSSARRALMYFDVAGAVPAGSTINSVSVTVHVSKKPATDTALRVTTLHTVTQDWGEGASDATGNEGAGAPSATGDATWLHTFYNTAFWDNPGGDFNPVASASVSILGVATYTWNSTPQLVADVQGWLDNPASNFGWLVLGDESVIKTARRIDSRENLTAGNRPQLTIDFTPISPVGACCDDFSGVCTASLTELDCTSGGGRFGGLGSTCATIDPPCLGSGACCDAYDGTCTDMVAEADCDGVGQRFGGAGTTCAGLDPPCEGPNDRLHISLQVIASGLTSPVALTHPGDGSGRLFVVDQIGLIRVIDSSGTLLPTPFLDVTSKMVTINGGYDERGLLGMTFHPDYASNGRFFIRYSAPRTSDGTEPCGTSCHKEVLAEYHVSGDPLTSNVADDTSEIVLYEADEPQFNHNGGDVAFGPDGYLYWTLGDGGGAHDGLADVPPSHGATGNGQNIETPLGSVLRIDVDSTPLPGLPYSIPPDNPFLAGCPVGYPDCVKEMFAWGFRNPFRFSFLPTDIKGYDGYMFIGDVGQNLFEEVDVITLDGQFDQLRNYGWVIREGLHCFDPLNPTVPPASCATTGALSEPLIDPVLEYDHTVGIAVIGGHAYQGSAVPALAGKYVFGDFSKDFGPTGSLFWADVSGVGTSTVTLGPRKGFFLSPADEPLNQAVFGIGEDQDGELYVLASDNIGPSGTGGFVYKIVPPVPPTADVFGDNPRYLAITIPPGSDPVGIVVTPACPAGVAQYVGTPFGADNIALLESDPLDAAFLTPEQWGRRVHVTGVDVVPNATYNVQLDGGSPGAPLLSSISSGTTTIWGDVSGPFTDGAWALPDNSVSVVDLVSILDTYGGLSTAIPKYRADLIGAGDSGLDCLPDQIISILEVVGYLDAFAGHDFESSTPCFEPCP